MATKFGTKSAITGLYKRYLCV